MMNRASVRFRRVVPDDYRPICDMLPSEEELFLVYAQGKYPLTVEQVAALVEKRTEPTVMLLDDRVIGFANFYGYKERRSVVIGNVVVDSSLRGKGLGKLLVSYMIDLAFRRYDLPRVKLHVYNRNLAGLLFYRSLGFEPYAMKPKKDYRGDTVVMFTLVLRRDTGAVK
jgi:ribosomal protein S18 acetylase RimI-like enzyme